MRVKQAYVSYNVDSFKGAFLKKFNLKDYHDRDEAAVFFGMYATLVQDVLTLAQHRGPAIVFWAGSDTMKIDRRLYNLIKTRDIKHIAQSKFCSDDLRDLGIDHELVPVTTASLDIKPVPRGDCVYFYGNRDFYGLNMVPEIESRTGLKIIKTTPNTYTRSELMGVYRECFIGLRLTPHDGLPHTVVELGLMGRRCLHNGSVPTVINYSGIGDICDSIMSEYKIRHRDNRWIAKEIKNYITITDGWLHINKY